jgi:deferrochelatase/peroxidase EfeB
VTTLPLADIQGFILRGYRYDVSCHAIVHCGGTAAQARAFLAELIPSVTTAQPWPKGKKPDSTLNVGITYKGLRALGLTPGPNDFPISFVNGAVGQAAVVCDTGANAPGNWDGNLGDPDTAHLTLTIYAKDAATLDAALGAWTAKFPAYGLTLAYRIDANALPDDGIHFGYRDSIAQPTIAGAPVRKHDRPDDQPVAPAGEFLMGYPSQMANITYSVKPAPLTLNSSFAAFRILEQDSAGFETFLRTAGAAMKLDPELIAAKVCGRWRNGTPLVLSPDSSTPPVADDQLNNFTYGSANAGAPDPLGIRCPVGAHIRRSNPRDQNVVTSPASGHLHRIVRHAMPYGPPYTGNGEDDGKQRGLVGFFINADLSNQFEFIMSSWINTAGFVRSVWLPAGGPYEGNPVRNIRGTDVFLGATPGTLTVTDAPQQPGGMATNASFPAEKQFITTKGAAYCYLPSITALTYLATMPV